jgi:hypothetical protein
MRCRPCSIVNTVCSEKAASTNNTAKSEVVHFNSSGSNVSVFNVKRVLLTHKHDFKYLRMVFYNIRPMNMIKSSARRWFFYGICFLIGFCPFVPEN